MWICLSHVSGDGFTFSFPFCVPCMSCLTALSRPKAQYWREVLRVRTLGVCSLSQFSGLLLSFSRFPLLGWRSFLLFLVCSECLRQTGVEFCPTLFFTYQDDNFWKRNRENSVKPKVGSLKRNKMDRLLVKLIREKRRHIFNIKRERGNITMIL